MTALLYELVDLLNNYDESEEKENRIRDLVCYFLDEGLDQDELYKTAIFEAAEKVRVFGYVKGTHRIEPEDINTNPLYSVRHQTIQNYYSSSVLKNNILDGRQKEIVNTFMLLDTKRLIVSAPTSFGKTYILREIIFLNRHRYNNILLVFPTIALLNENTTILKELIHSLHYEYKIINNVYSGFEVKDRNIFILTPERTLKLFADNPDIKIDFFFFDEVYKIDEDFNLDESSEKTSELPDAEKKNKKQDNRAKAFRIALYLLSKSIPEFYIAGPYLNLEKCKEGFKKYLELNNVFSYQVDFEPTVRVEIDAWKKKSIEYHPIFGERIIEIYPTGNLSTEDKIIYTIKYLRDRELGQAIFYYATPAASMNYIQSVTEKVPMLQRHTVDTDFINHLKRRYGLPVQGSDEDSSTYWSFIKALENGYGIHHGKFPKYIQNEVLKMFEKGVFDYLFCTSTIIEGVNTNAKNVVIVNNSVGNAEMSAFALKNIKGRAGRYYRHNIGRIFLTSPKQREIEQKHELCLDFPTYNQVEILDVDLDNAEIRDLAFSNQERKSKRDQSFDIEKLPDEVFIKNRLFARDVQERYLEHLSKPVNFFRFSPLIQNSHNIYEFLGGNMMENILKSFEACNIIDANKAMVYRYVVSNYSQSGTVGVIGYHLGRDLKKNENLQSDTVKVVDKAYIKAFEQIRNIAEYEVPRFLCLFEAIYQRVGELKGYDMEDFNMSPIIRFFELGVKTEFGLALVEYGFPIDTIREIEKRLPDLAQLAKVEAIAFLRERQNREIVLDVLDKYELSLFAEAIKFMEK